MIATFTAGPWGLSSLQNGVGDALHELPVCSFVSVSFPLDPLVLTPRTCGAENLKVHRVNKAAGGVSLVPPFNAGRWPEGHDADAPAVDVRLVGGGTGVAPSSVTSMRSVSLGWRTSTGLFVLLAGIKGGAFGLVP